jgi:hypothetical protein
MPLFSGPAMIPSNESAILLGATAVDITFAKRPLKLIVQVWVGGPIYVRLNATGASPIVGNVIKVTTTTPLMVEDVALTSAVPLSIYNGSGVAFIWNGANQSGCILAW